MHGKCDACGGGGMNGLPYYKAYPRDFIEGTIGMPFELKGAYRLVLDLIYMQGGKLPDDPRYISGLLGCSIRKWKSMRNDLVEMGKIQVNGEFLANYRAEKELETLAKLQEVKRENRSRSSKIKDLSERPSDDTEPEPEPDNTHPYGCDADGVLVSAKNIWKNGFEFFVETGLSDRAAKSVIGRLIKDFGSARSAQAIEAARAAGTLDPVPYVTEFLRTGDDVASAFERLSRNA